MTQSAHKVLDHAQLFNTPEYRELLARKAKVDGMPSAEETCKVDEWTRTREYREKNFAREALTVNPAKACQPLGAVFAAAGFARTLSFVHGSQGCVAYYRSHLARHFKEPVSAVSSSMTEDAAVFGGLSNLTEGLTNALKLYAPQMIAVSTTCMAEVIGDDLQSFIQEAKLKGAVPADYPVPFAHTPAFVGSHTTGYDNMLHGILEHFWKGQERSHTHRLNVIPGFDGFAVGNNRELKRILELMGIEYTLLSDVADQFDTPSDGQFRMYSGGTTLAQARSALDAGATLSLQAACTHKTLAFAHSHGQKTAALHYPLGVGGTDELILTLKELAGKDEVPAQLELERGRLVDALADSQSYLHGKTYAIYGDPDFVYGMARFVLETGGEPRHCLATNGNAEWAEQMSALFARSPHGAGCQAWPGRDLWHLRSLMATEPVELLIGNSYGKYLERDLKTPLIRLTFPIFDRHHHHRFPLWGYQGGLQVLRTILDKIFDGLDAQSNEPGKTDISFDLTR